MKEKTQKILNTWHKHFSDEDRQYSEFEDSDIEYFVALAKTSVNPLLR